MGLWWELYAQEVFPLLVPFRRWAKVQEELDLGAIVLVYYASKLAGAKYRMGRVVELLPGVDGLVRSVRVALRNLRKGAREHVGECRAGTTTLVLPVQRLVLLLPGREQPAEIIEKLRVEEATRPAREAVRDEALRPVVDLGGEEIIDL